MLQVLRVYIGSFWERPINDIGRDNEALFRAEQVPAALPWACRAPLGVPRLGVPRPVNPLREDVYSTAATHPCTPVAHRHSGRARRSSRCRFRRT